jgi:hypothetical protein
MASELPTTPENLSAKFPSSVKPYPFIFKKKWLSSSREKNNSCCLWWQ